MKRFLTISVFILSVVLFWSCGSDDNPVNSTGKNFDPFALWDTASGTLGGWVQCLAAKDSFLYAGTNDSGIYVSVNNGDAWTNRSVGLTGLALNVHCLFMKDSVILAGTSNRIFRSTDKGASWSAFGTGITAVAVITIVPKDTNLYAGTTSGVFRSSDGGQTWTASDLSTYSVYTLAVKKNIMFAGTNNGTFRSSDNGAHWFQFFDASLGPNTYSLAVKDTFVFAANIANVFRTSNDSSWTLVGGGLPVHPVPVSFFVTSSSLLVGLEGYQGVYLSVNNGVSWISCNSGFTAPFTAYTFLYNGSYLFVGGMNQGAGGAVWRHAL